MHLQITLIIFIIFQPINKALTQGIINPCPRMFDYVHDGTEWFGLIGIRSPNFGEILHLKVILNMNGIIIPDHLGSIQLLSRIQHQWGEPVLYKVIFPKSNYPPNLALITVNNKVFCRGPPDHRGLVPQVVLQHIYPNASVAVAAPSPSFRNYDPFQGAEVIPVSLINTDNKHLPSVNKERSGTSHLENICGSVDERKRFQAPTKFSRLTDEMPKGGEIFRATENGGKVGKNDEDLPTIVIGDDDYISKGTTRSGERSVIITELPSINRGAWPWLAAVYVNHITSLSYQCAGTLISSRVVISAAHCFHSVKKRYTANDVFVFLGRHNLRNFTEDDSLATPVDDIVIHPEYNVNLSSFDADIAVIILKNEVRFNSFIRPACLWSARKNIELIEEEDGFVVGWGLGALNTTQNTSANSTVPKIFSMPIVSDYTCFQTNPLYRNLSSNRTFCAGIVLQANTATETKYDSQNTATTIRHQLKEGPCSGDSGAGLMIFKSNRWVLRGIVSGIAPLQKTEDDSVTVTPTRSNNTCAINQYVIYADVAKFLDWIFAFLI